MDFEAKIMKSDHSRLEAGATPPPRSFNGQPGRKPAGFRLPMEHGAWWTFFTAWAFSGWLAWRLNAPLYPALLLLALEVLLFLPSDWLVLFFAWGIKGHSFGPASARAWQGWALVLPALFCLGLMTAGFLKNIGQPFFQFLAFFSVMGVLVMILRILVAPRHLLLLCMSSVMLSAPWALMAGLNQDLATSLKIWAPLGAYFAATPVFVQAWLRGATWPAWRRYLPVLILALGTGALAWLGKEIAAWIMAALVARMAWRLASNKRPQAGQAPQPRAVRALGFEQAFWSMAYCAALVSAAP